MSRRVFVAGCNMPGYLPDDEPAQFDTFEEAKAYILELMQWHLDSEEGNIYADEAALETLAECLDWAHVQTGDFGITASNTHYWVSSEFIIND